VAFYHEIPEDEKGKNLEPEKARSLAETFLTNFIKINLSDYELVDQVSTRKTSRTDYTLTWKKKNLALKEAQLRLKVIIHGDRIDGFDKYLKVPENFVNKQNRQNQKGNLLVILGFILSFGFLICIFVVFLLALKKRRLKWKYTIPVAILLGVVSLLSGLNSIPLAISQFGTTTSLGVNIFYLVFTILINCLLSGLFIILIASSGDVVYKESFPEKLPLSKSFTLRGFLSREYISATIVGYCLAFFHLAYVSIFYWGGARYFGVWSPPESPYDNALSTVIPWIYPLLIGLSASLMEELVFRLFAISFLRKYLKNLWLAILIPSVIWAILHCNYPQQPYYIRAVELVPVAIIMSIVFIRYGIFSTLISHYTVNATLGSFIMLTSSNLYFKISGGIVTGLALVPLLVAWVAHGRQEKHKQDEKWPFEEKPAYEHISPGAGESIPIPGYHTLFPHEKDELPEKTDLDRDLAGIEEPEPGEIIPKAEEKPTVERQHRRHYVPLKVKSIIFLTVLSLIGLIFIGLYGEAVEEKDTVFAGLSVTRHQAELNARGFLNQLGYNTDEWASCTYFYNELGGLSSIFLIQKAGEEKYNQLVKNNLDLVGWRTRFYRPLEREYFRVSIDPEGKPTAFYHKLKEDTPGKSLDKNRAFEKAEADIRNIFKIKTEDYELVSKRQEKLKKRTDYFYTWKLKSPRIENSSFRIDYILQGDMPGKFRRYLKLPEDWIRLREKVDFSKAIATVVLVIIFLVVIGWIFIQFVIRFASNRLSWKFPFIIASTLTGLIFISIINNYPVFMKSYLAGEQSLSSYYLIQLLMIWFMLLVNFFVVLIMAALAESIFIELFPHFPGPRRFFQFSSWNSIEVWDGIFLMITAGIIIGAISIVFREIQLTYFPDTITPGQILPASLDSVFPALGIIIQAIQLTVFSCFGFMLLIGFMHKVIKRRILMVFFIILMAILMAKVTSFNEREFLVNTAIFLSLSLVAAWLIQRYIRFNRIFYVIGGFIALIFVQASELVEFSNKFFVWNGYILIGMAFLISFVLFLMLRFLPGENNKEKAAYDEVFESKNENA